MDILGWLDKAQEYAPLIKTGATVGMGVASYLDQKRKNEMQQAAYNDYMQQVEAAGQEARAAIDLGKLGQLPMVMTGVPQTKADVTDFTAVAARGGLMSVPNKQRKRYFAGTDQEEIEVMDIDVTEPTTPDLEKETGLDLSGEQVFYDTGQGDRANAAQIWGQMRDNEKSIFKFDFEIFFMDGGWRDMIRGQAAAPTGDTQMASDPGMGEGPFMMEEFLQAVQQEGFTGSYQDYIDQIDRSPADYMGQARSAEGIMQAAQGGRIGYAFGPGPVVDKETVAQSITLPDGGEEVVTNIDEITGQTAGLDYGSYKDFIESTGDEELMNLYVDFLATGDFTNLGEALKRKGYPGDFAKGGRIGYATGSEGIMDLGGLEKDYRTSGGFVPIGAYEKKDDVPARLSKNEFVMTADAVRAAGGGSINRGAQLMYDTMKNLEARPQAQRMIT